MSNPTSNTDFNLGVNQEDFNLAGPIANTTMPTWQRKPLEASQESNRAPTSTPAKQKKKNPYSQVKKRPKKNLSFDRFIPNRNAMNADMSRFSLNYEAFQENLETFNAALRPKPKEGGQPKSPDLKQVKRDARYSSVLASSLLGIPFDPLVGPAELIPKSKILSFKEMEPKDKGDILHSNRVFGKQMQFRNAIQQKAFRHIHPSAFQMLDAPAIPPDFYRNILDWGQSNILAVALDFDLYLWDGETGETHVLLKMEPGEDSVTALAWMPNNEDILAVGTQNAEVMLWDIRKQACVMLFRSHRSRVCALAWNGSTLTSGSRDGEIHIHDATIPESLVANLVGHQGAICGLAWNKAGTQLASGGNDDRVCIWDHRRSQRIWTPKYTFEDHAAAVKALSWCPWQPEVLATGGGTEDGQLRFWNTSTGAALRVVDTKSQICGIIWNPHDKELITSHGYPKFQLTVWRYPSLERMAELKGHRATVLHMSLGPDGETVVSAGGDETIRFWKVFRAFTQKNRSGRAGREELPSTSRSLRRCAAIR